jgi:CDP-glycerol glycerophosphotransferase
MISMNAWPRSCVRLRKLVAQTKRAVHYERRLRARRAPIDEHAVMYESFAGNGMLCNPEAIFRALLRLNDLQHLHHVWALSDLDHYADTVAEFAGDPRVRFVQRGSAAYYAALSSAKYLINNATFPEPFVKRPGQVYLNTWHGTPLKAMGYDAPHGAAMAGNVVRNLVSADYLLAPNADTAQMYMSGYRMSNIFRGRMIAEGTPRIDRQFADAPRRAQIRATLAAQGVALRDSDKILLYAPTWKGEFAAPTYDVQQLLDLVDAVTSRPNARDYRLLVKVHQQVYKYARDDRRLRGLLVPNEVPTNDILAITDTVITDYSSIFIDFLTTGRPVLFYTPDLDEYTLSRGVYLSPKEWPGPVCRDLEQLIAELDQLGSGSDADPSVAFADTYLASRERYCAREDGNASDRIADIVFRGETRDYDVRGDFTDGRSSILINLGGMLGNGITTAALSLLDNIDHDRFDVSVSFPHAALPDQQRRIELINPRVRRFPQPGTLNGSKLRIKILAMLNGRRPGRRQILLSRCAGLMGEEWRRSFGDSRFDHVIDFSGYEPYWIKLLASRTAGSFSIWLHNDIHAEMSNTNRAARLRARIRSSVALYRVADHLVSVSEPLCQVNRASLAEWASSERFTFARNTINADRIRGLAGETVPMAHLPATGVQTFVTAGRLSAEKNHHRLISAFAIVHRADAATRLVILGSGPLFDQLRGLVDDLGLGPCVTLAGYEPNPYPIMAKANCFVLSSDYEGQPMALLEALILGLPIVTTSFDSVRGALPPATGLVVARDVEALAEGMQKFLRNEVANPPFDDADYNRRAMAEFYRAIESAMP